MSAADGAGSPMLPHERRVCRRLEARGEPGLGEALVRLDGTVLGRRFRIDSLYAVGAEGAVYLATDTAAAPGASRLVAKVPLHPVHRPFDLTEEDIRRRRDGIREEASHLEQAASRYMPRMLGLLDAAWNPAMERDWGGAFAEPEPVMIMEKLPGFDLDLWLARMHGSRVPKPLLRRQLDHVAVVVLTALMELQRRGFYYCDLRPGNVRIRGRSKERVRLLDAGSLVRIEDRSGRFPHVPAYLPPALFAASRAGETLLPAADVQAVMAGRSLYEVATGRVPLPGEDVESSVLYGTSVSPSIAETIERLCRGDFADVADALAYLSENHVPEPEPEPAPGRQRAASAIQKLTSALAAKSAPAAAPRAPAAVPATTTGPGVFHVDRQSAPEPAKPVRDLHSVLAAARRGSPAGASGAPQSPAASAPREEPRRPASVGKLRAIDRPAHEDAEDSITVEGTRPSPAPSERPAPEVPAFASRAAARRSSVVSEDPLAPMPLAQAAASRPSRGERKPGTAAQSEPHLRELIESKTAVALEDVQPSRPTAAPQRAPEPRPAAAKPQSATQFLRESAHSADVLPEPAPRPWWKRVLRRLLGR